MSRTIAIVGSVVILLVILHDAFEVMLLPRRVKSRLRIVRLFFRFTWWIWSRIARRIDSTDKRHIYLSLYGPLSMVWLLVVWAGGLVAGFGTLYWALDPGRPAPISWPNQLYFSGVTFFTLGYGDVVPHTGIVKLLAVLEAGTGLGFIAIVIGYLPVLYQLFARREARVIMLDAVAGSPPSAVTLLTRHAEGQGLPELEILLHEWQQWCAELMESQLSYPMLAFYRSQHDNQSWLAALTTMMDSCALLMVGLKGVRTFAARLTFSTARQAVIEMGRVFQVGAVAPDVDRLPAEAFAVLRNDLAEAGLQFADDEDAEQKLAAFRNTYEPFLNGLADYLVLSLPDWMSTGETRDNWENNPRGKSARQLVDAVPAKPE
jgi:voltage-gated potassium channel Kch